AARESPSRGSHRGAGPLRRRRPGGVSRARRRRGRPRAGLVRRTRDRPDPWPEDGADRGRARLLERRRGHPPRQLDRLLSGAIVLARVTRRYSLPLAKRATKGSERAGRSAFLTGVFLVSLAALVFQIVQTRILSVLAWYYLAFFAISVAMLGMTAGAVWVHLRADRFRPERLAGALANAASAAALSMLGSLAVQLSLITTLTLSITTLVAWSLLLAAMTVPYFFVGIAVSLALTRSPYPVSLVYAVDLVGAALGCIAVVAILNVLDAPSTVLLAGAIA